MPTARANPPSVIMLMVCPIRLRAITEHRIARGMEVAIISVLLQLPRNNRIMKAVRHAAIRASRTTPAMALFTKID
jgi:hypothetical protein